MTADAAALRGGCFVRVHVRTGVLARTDRQLAVLSCLFRRRVRHTVLGPGNGTLVSLRGLPVQSTCC